jgi:hypothetical protein
MFVAIQLAASVVFDYGWPQVRFPFFHEQLCRFDASGRDANILCLGSSRTRCLLNEAVIEQVLADLTGDTGVHCFNAQVPNGDIIVSERMLRALLHRGARPRFALIELCPEGLNRRNGWLIHYVVWLLRWDDVPAYLKDLTVTGNLVRFAGTRFVPTHVYRYQIRQQLWTLARDWLGEHPTATATNPRREPYSTGRSRKEAADYWQGDVARRLREQRMDPKLDLTFGTENVDRALRSYRPGGNAAAALERMLNLCRAHNIEPILVGVPLSSPHRHCYTLEIEAAFQLHVARVTQMHGCRYLHYRDSLPDAFFADHHHASDEGGYVFSRMICLDVLAPAWQSGTN